MTTPQILDGIRVVELGTGVATAVAALQLAEVGADVVLIEPPGGSPLRATPGFRTWGRSKRSVQLDLGDGVAGPGGRPADEADRRRLDRLLAGADILLHDLGPSRAARLDLDDASLGRRHPHLIVSSILGWPVGHPGADAPVDDQLTLARLGVLDEQLGVGGRSPIYVRFPLGTWPAAWLALTGVLSRLLVRERTGIAGPAHTSLAQGALVPMMMHWSRAETPSADLALGMPKDDMRPSLFECADGRWIHIMPPEPAHTPLMREVFAELGPEAVARENDRHRGRGMAGWENWGAIVAALGRRPIDAWLEDLWASDVPAQEAVGFGRVLSDPQAGANGYVVTLDDPVAGPIMVPGLPLTLDPPAAIRHPAPSTPGADDPPDWEPVGARPVAGHRADGPPAVSAPLDGLKVLDFGNFLAGPLGPMVLADLGATVVKVEATSGDPMRRADWPFAGCQRGKRAVALDLRSPASRPALDALLRWADVVHHNLRRPAARRLGLDAAAVRAVNPDVVFCHVSSYGPVGGRADWPGYDQLFQASCGWEVEGAGEGNPPMWHRFGFMDHLCALSSAAATLLALYHRDRTGTASDVAASLLGSGALTNGETFLRSDGTLAPVPTLDAGQLTLTPGRRLLELDDCWVALSATTGAQMASLAEVFGAVTCADIPCRVPGRSGDEAIAALERRGVPVARVRRDQGAAFFDDPDHLAAGLVAVYQHADWGRLEQPGRFWALGGLEVRLDRAPPVLGQHTVEVLAEVGLGSGDIDALLASGVALAPGR